jgi:hypothetical protein
MEDGFGNQFAAEISAATDHWPGDPSHMTQAI